MEVRYDCARDGLARCNSGSFELGSSDEKKVGGVSKVSRDSSIDEDDRARRRRMKDVTAMVRVGGLA